MLQNPFDFFEAIYCLTTETRAKKYESAMREFQSIGIADRIVKFNGTEIDRKYANCTCNNKKLSHALASASHLEIWRNVSKKGLSNVLIFEDDVSFVRWDNEALLVAINTLSASKWELFYLGYNLFGDSFDYKTIAANLIELPTGSDVRSAHAYCLSCASYRKVLGYNPFCDKVVDQWLPSTLAIHCLIPLMTVQTQYIDGHQKRETFLDNYKNKLAGQE